LVPTNHRLRLHDHQRAAPVEQSRQYRQADAGCRIDSPGPVPTFDVQRQLAAQQEILGLDAILGPKQQQHPAEGVFDETTYYREQAGHALMVSQRSIGSQRGLRG
jgi:hypothetical protein